MENIISIDTEALNEVISSLETKLANMTEIYDSLNTKLELLNGESDVWKGPSQEETYEYYKEISSRFPDTLKKLDNFITYLKKTVQDYKNEDDSIIKDLEINENNLSIN